jgi:hypothetical protein
MVDCIRAKDFFLKCCPSWNCVATDSIGLSGGLISGWNPLKADFLAFHIFVGILLEGRIKDFSFPLKLLNCYGPYKDRLSFWKHLEDSGFLKEDNIIIGGDLNLTLSSGDIWGDRARLDPLSDFFSSLFASAGLIDIAPSQICPTWRNGRSGPNGVSKRLDHFLLNENILGIVNMCRSWVLNNFFSDHNPIFLQVEELKDPLHFPFKFNHAWLLESYFQSVW